MITEKIRTWRDSARVVIVSDPKRSEGANQSKIGLQPGTHKDFPTFEHNVDIRIL